MGGRGLDPFAKCATAFLRLGALLFIGFAEYDFLAAMEGMLLLRLDWLVFATMICVPRCGG